MDANIISMALLDDRGGLTDDDYSNSNKYIRIGGKITIILTGRLSGVRFMVPIKRRSTSIERSNTSKQIYCSNFSGRKIGGMPFRRGQLAFVSHFGCDDGDGMHSIANSTFQIRATFPICIESFSNPIIP